MHGNTGAARAERVAIVAVGVDLIGVMVVENGQLRCGARVETISRRRSFIIRLASDVPGVAVPDDGGNMLTDIRRNGFRLSAQI